MNSLLVNISDRIKMPIPNWATGPASKEIYKYLTDKVYTPPVDKLKWKIILEEIDLPIDLECITSETVWRLKQIIDIESIIMKIINTQNPKLLFAKKINAILIVLPYVRTINFAPRYTCYSKFYFFICRNATSVSKKCEYITSDKWFNIWCRSYDFDIDYLDYQNINPSIIAIAFLQRLLDAKNKLDVFGKSRILVPNELKKIYCGARIDEVKFIKLSGDANLINRYNFIMTWGILSGRSIIKRGFNLYILMRLILPHILITTDQTLTFTKPRDLSYVLSHVCDNIQMYGTFNLLNLTQTDNIIKFLQLYI